MLPSSSRPSAASHPTARLAIFKGERSGSTWLARQLQAVGPRHAFITEEAIGGVRTVPDALKLQHLRRCLVQPTARLQELVASNCSDGGRPTNSCYAKPLRRIIPRILGFSVDPTHHSPRAYARVLLPFPRVLVVAYLRSNLVKWSVSVLRGGLLRKSCGWNPSAACAARHGQQRHAVPPVRLLRQIYRRQQVTQQGLSAASAAAPRMLVLVYEALQVDTRGTLAELHQALGVALPPPKQEQPPTPQQRQQRQKQPATLPRLQLAKVTGDNLSSVLEPASYAAIERELRGRPCLHAQLTAATPTPFPLLQCTVDYPPSANKPAADARPSFVGTAEIRPVGRR